MMKKYLFHFVVLLLALFGLSVHAASTGGAFTVTQYSLTRQPRTLNDAENALNNSSIWDGLPVTKLYRRISFADYPGVKPPFKTKSFPGNATRKHEWFVIEATGKILIPEAGQWTLAGGSDDGFKVEISGNDFSAEFSSTTVLGYDVTLKTLDFPVAGVYAIRMLYFEYATCSILHFSMSKGYRSSFDSSVFKLVEAAQDNDSYFVTFDANEGEGEMDDQFFADGQSQSLLLNTFTRPGYHFMGWALEANGKVVYQDGANIKIDHDEILYAIWANEQTLAAELSNWSSGSITLRCEDCDSSGITHKYSLEYCNESGEWTAVDGAKNILATKGQNSSGQEVWIAKLTDPSFSSRLGGIPPVSYRVTDENGRVSEPCVTRTRYGLAVGVGAYDPKLIALYQKNRKTPPAELSQCRHDAELFHEVMTTGGGGIASGNMKLLRDGEARREDIGREWRNLSQKTKPGDVVFFAISTHGSSSGSILAYDGSYTRAAFQTDLEPFRTGNCNNVKVVAVLMNCHSETMTSAERNIGQEYGGLCTANILYLTEASAEESGWTMPYYSQFGEFLFNKGLKLRQADCQKSLGRISGTFGDRNGRVDLLECARYASALAVGMSDQSPTHPQYDSLKASLMANTIVVAYDTGETPVQVAVAPSECKVYSTSRGIWVLWDDVEGADYYIVRYALSSGGSTAHWKYVKGYSSSFESISEFLSGFIDSRLWDNGFLFKTCDVASAKDREIYVPLENDTDYRFEIVAVNGAGQSASCFSEVVRTPSAIQPPSYVVSLDANGGTVSPATLSIQGNGVVGPLPVPTSTGREFLGWFSDVAGGYEIHDDSLVTQDVTYHAHWTKNPMEDQMNPDWAMCYPSVLTISGGDIATAVSMTAANGCRTVGECYALGINPEDPNDDLRISQFEMQEGKPQLMLNHTADGSGKSFLPDVRILGTTALGESSQWDDVTDIANPDASGYRFFKATVELP